MLKKVIRKEEWEKELADIEINKEAMNKLVMNYFVTEGYAEAAEKFRLESGTVRIDLSTIIARKLIKKALMEGNVEEAIEKINDMDPEILETNHLLFFHLKLQRFIEFIRQRDYDSALEFSNQELVPIGTANPNLLEELEETVALIAFDDMSISPLKELMGQAQRDKRANEVNTAILARQNREKDPKLQKLLKILLWAQSQLEETMVFPHITDLSNATVQELVPW